jgi:hypothetical protein
MPSKKRPRTYSPTDSPTGMDELVLTQPPDKEENYSIESVDVDVDEDDVAEMEPTNQDYLIESFFNKLVPNLNPEEYPNYMRYLERIRFFYSFAKVDSITEGEDESDLINLQKYFNFLKSEILFRGNRLLYLLYLEIYPYLEEEFDYEYINSKSTERNGKRQAFMNGGRQNLDALNNALSNNDYVSGIQLIYSLKLLAELHHDFKGSGKTLIDLTSIIELYNINISQFETNIQILPNELLNFYNSLKSGHGEWHFFKCTLDYLIDNGMFDELSVIKYRSVTNSSGQKDYYMIDIDGNQVTEPLFDNSEFDIRYPDNSTCDSALSKLLRDSDLTWKPKLIIQNAPSLTDPATIGLIDVSKFYPVVANDGTPLDIRYFNFQKCQDLNNYFDPLNRIIVGIMCEGINAFFKLFGGSYANNYNTWDVVETTDMNYVNLYSTAPIKFIIMNSTKTTQIPPTDDYIQYLQELNNNTLDSRRIGQFYYSGIIIQSTEYPSVGYELRVGDTTIKNITKLVNSDYIANFIRPGTTPTQTTLEHQSWYRLCRLSNYIKSTITDDRFNGKPDAMVLKFLIVCLKALGDWFQVYYVSSIHYRCLNPIPGDQPDMFTVQFKDFVKYLSSSDKNTIADMMIHSISDPNNALRYLGNGFCIKPSENLYKRFPAFFDNPAIPQEGYGEDFGTSILQTSNEDLIPPEGKDNEENEDVDDGAGVGSLKGIFLNFQKKGEDLKGKVKQLLANAKKIYEDLIATVENNADATATANAEYNVGIFRDIVTQQNVISLFDPALNSDSIIDRIVNDELLKKLKQSLTKIPLIYQMMTDNIADLENDMNVLIELSEKEQKSIAKLSELKRDLTSGELNNLDEVYASEKWEGLKEKLDAKIQKIIGPVNPVNNEFLYQRITGFSQKIEKKVKDARLKMSSFFRQIKDKSSQVVATQRQGRRLNIPSFGIVDFIRKYDPIFNKNVPTGGGRRQRARRTLKNVIRRTMKNTKFKANKKPPMYKSFKKRVGMKYKTRMTRVKK